MESDIICLGFKVSESLYGVRYHRFIADVDSSVFKQLQDLKPYKNIVIEKIECKNHLYRNFNSKFRDFVTCTGISKNYLKK